MYMAFKNALRNVRTIHFNKWFTSEVNSIITVFGWTELYLDKLDTVKMFREDSILKLGPITYCIEKPTRLVDK